VTDDEARQRFANARVARLATIDANANPHLVPICFAVDRQNGTIYSAVDAKPKTTPDLKRLRNIERHPQVTLLVDHYEEEWTKVWWVRVDGTATVHDIHEQGRAALTAKYEQYTDALLGRIVVVEPARWTSWAYADPV
jgi:PPOX class probable F420-dependent enzyme